MKVPCNVDQHLWQLKSYLLFFIITVSCPNARAQSDANDHVRNKKIFLRAFVSKSSCFVGEPLILTYKLYSAIKAKSDILQMPRLNGFTTSAIHEIGSLNPAFEIVHGQNFQVYEIKKLLLTPVISGRLVIDPMEIENVISSQANQAPDEQNSGTVGDLLDQLTDAQSLPLKSMIVRSYSNQLEVKVTDLPISSSRSIQSTSVGNFIIRGNIKPGKIFANEAFVISVIIKGKGNLIFTDPPEINFPTGTTIIGIQEPENKPARTADLHIFRRFDYTVSTTQAGTLVVPGVEFTYFDPSAKAFKTTTSKPLKVLVEASRMPDIIATPSNTSAPQPQVSKAVPTQGKYKGYQMIPLFVSLIGIVIIATVFIRTIRMTETNVLAGKNWQGGTRCKTGNADPMPPGFVKIQEMFESNDFKMFYHELYSALWQSISYKLNVRPIEQNKTNILALLRSSGWGSEEIIELADIFDRCAWNLYVPDPENNKSYTEIYERATRVLQRLEQDYPVAS
jgi:hypothetical protein